MNITERVELIEKLLKSIEELVPLYMSNPEDFAISRGVATVCIIDEDFKMYGKMFGTNKTLLRESYKWAWTKASQVWMTGIKTLDFEKLVYADKVDFYSYGLNMPDLIGWEGGQPIKLEDDSILSIGFSGFRGSSDLEIVTRALTNANIQFTEV